MGSSTSIDPWGAAERRRLVRLCASLSGDAGAAEDLAQETLLEAWRNAHKLHDPAGAERWLAAIARHVSLRRGRRAGRQAAVEAAVRAAAVADAPGEESSATDELERALARLPEPARELLVRRHVDERPPAELAAELGLSEDAVSMRLARARAELRRALAADDAWRPTRVWCAQCGRRRLLTRSGNAVSFRCPGCNPGADAASSEYRLDNPVFGALLGAVSRPTAVLARAARWSQGYFASGAGADAECTRCARPVALRRYERPEHDAHRHGLHASCATCGEVVSSSLGGLALVQPAVERFREEHRRIEARAVLAVDFGGAPALVAEYGSVLGSPTVAAVFARDTLALLAVR
jgi:RNA polymerase sigma factor (sigma-70 family)